MAYPHSIVVDIDDCISFTTNRDFANAIANEQLISKLNALFDSGWDVYYVTARGSLSCKTREEAKQKYQAQIETWLAKHGCKYTELSFDKKLASYYIDDKAYKPEEFIDLQFKKFNTGLSGAETELRDNKVYKTANNTQQTVKWYSVASKFFNTPKIYSVIGNTICMEYLCNDETQFNIFTVIDTIINREKYIPSISTANFDSYITRCNTHLTNIDELDERFKNELLDTFTCYKSEFDSNITFCHGDLTIDNILCNDSKLYLIDPNYSDDLYSSYILDIGKLLHSLNRYNRAIEYNTLLNYYADLRELCLIAEISHWIRLYKYANTTLRTLTIDKIKEVYGQLR